MSPERLAARHTAAIARHWRTLVDSGGQAPAQLLYDLEAIAETHARDVGVIAVKPADDCPPGEPAARRRAPARGRAK